MIDEDGITAGHQFTRKELDIVLSWAHFVASEYDLDEDEERIVRELRDTRAFLGRACGEGR